jgi:hypothetical protein
MGIWTWRSCFGHTFDATNLRALSEECSHSEWHLGGLGSEPCPITVGFILVREALADVANCHSLVCAPVNLRMPRGKVSEDCC